MQTTLSLILRVRLWVGCLLLTAWGFSAQATIPLVLKQTIQLPSGGPWDVQHVMNDTTYGWACVSGNDISYKLSEQHTVRHCTVPTRVFGQYSQYRTDQSLRFMKMNTANEHLCVLLFTRMPTRLDPMYYSDDVGFCYLDLETAAVLDTLIRAGSGHEELFSHYSSWRSDYYEFAPWPPLPDTSTSLYYCGNSSLEGYNPGGQYYGSWSGFCNKVTFADSMHETHLGPWNNVQPFRPWGEPDFALSGSSGDWRQSDMGPREGVGYCYVGRIAGSNVMRDTLQDCQTAVAQMDEDGTRRLIYGNFALDPATFTTLWQRELPSGRTYSARLPGNHDERILVEDDHLFRVYNAADGSFIDWTSVFWGDSVMIRKRQDGPSEILVYDRAHNLVRVYETVLPPARGLTISYIPETRTIRLRWPRVEAASGYNICAFTSATGIYALLAHVPATTLIYDVPLTAHAQFFYVTDVYEQP
jgi:hypothetical protein